MGSGELGERERAIPNSERNSGQRMSLSPEFGKNDEFFFRKKTQLSFVEKTSCEMDKFFVKEGKYSKSQPGNEGTTAGSSSGNPASDVERSLHLSTENATVIHNNRQRHLPIHKQRELLPIFHYKTAIIYLLEKFQTLVLVGDTGCGKSTQLPLYAYEAGWTANGSAVVCTQPRRLAVLTVATRVAEEFGCRIGEQVGYGTRFDFKCSSITKIKYYTDHILLREMISDPLLSKYSIVIVDEAHQRTLNTDILLGLLKKIQKKRPIDFRIIITSATLDAISMKNFFESNENEKDSTLDTATILSIQGKQSPVDILYLKEPCSNYLKKCLETIYLIHESEDVEGDILVFLPSSEEVEFLLKSFQNDLDSFHSHEYYQPLKDSGKQAKRGSLDTLFMVPLYSTLPHYLQMKVFEITPYQQRKVILATNIAESSITIENIKYVIDSGYQKLTFFDITSGIENSIVCEISKSNAIQRAGRAGRMAVHYGDHSIGGNKCFRLMTEVSFEALPAYPLCEIQRMDLSYILLQLKSLNIKDILHFDFLSIPSSSLIIYSFELLYNLQAIDAKGNLTSLGYQMSEMPIEPKLSKCLLSSLYEFACTEEILSIVSMLCVEYPFQQLRSIMNKSRSNLNEQQIERLKKFEKDYQQFCVIGSDHLTLLKIFQGFQESNYSQSYADGNSLISKILAKAKEIRENLLMILKKIMKKEEQTQQALQSSLLLMNEVNENDPVKKKRKLESAARANVMICSVGDDDKTIRKCLISGFFANIAKLSNKGVYQLLRGGKAVEPHPHSVISKYGQYPEYVLFNDVVYDNSAKGSASFNGGFYRPGQEQQQVAQIREITKINPLWLYDVASHYYDLKM
jgi:ATP-dependent RNA helicase DDX35